MDYLKNNLTQIGFTEYEAKVYLALLQENPATGYQLSKKSGVPRSMVYEALGRLSIRGAVLETVEGRATLYSPLPPDVLLDRYEEEQLYMLAGLREGLKKAYQSSNEDKIWSITGQRATYAYAGQMLREAQSEVYAVLNDEDLSALEKEFNAVCERGVSVNALLTGKASLACGQVAYHPPIESELQELTGTLVIVSDNQNALIASSNHETVATITANRNLVLMARQFIWMELFAQRIYTRLGPDFVDQLDPEDQKIFIGLKES
ncbi:MAG TPA: TrmB family transcriptional regulator [Chloroflexi bacterium]|nr:TrmB family transcriptional regulator [Chloroflexota bacterium]HBY08749.1 TrmB family transcriptional regulator [Chloroflexota bacterium]